MTLDDLRRYAVARSLFAPTTLQRALTRMGFVQADPIRAPARAQDLILRPRVKGYQAGDLERRYDTLEIDEDFFVNYGFVTRAVRALMHPRPSPGSETSAPAQRRREKLLLEFVAQRGTVHPREVEAHFAQGTVRNYWGGSSHATTQMLDALHYRGLLAVARREKGIRIYRTLERRFETAHDAAQALLSTAARLDALVDLAARLYAPLPGVSLSYYVRRLRYAVPQWQTEIAAALARARARLGHAQVAGLDWYWPNEESPRRTRLTEAVRFLAPFDPVVHDRKRFELFWGWNYRFEAYTPASKRKLGYYALPLLWRDRVIGWANFAVKNGRLTSELGYAAGSAPRERAYSQELAAELSRMRIFLGANA